MRDGVGWNVHMQTPLCPMKKGWKKTGYGEKMWNVLFTTREIKWFSFALLSTPTQHGGFPHWARWIGGQKKRKSKQSRLFLWDKEEDILRKKRQTHGRACTYVLENRIWRHRSRTLKRRCCLGCRFVLPLALWSRYTGRCSDTCYVGQQRWYCYSSEVQYADLLQLFKRILKDMRSSFHYPGK